MAKKKNKQALKAPKTLALKPEEEVVADNVETEEVQPVKTEEIKKENKVDNKAGNKKKAKTKEKTTNKLVKKTKETFSELKKVSWPSFKTVVKNTCVVIVVVVLFTIVLFGIDRGLAALYNLIPR